MVRVCPRALPQASAASSRAPSRLRGNSDTFIIPPLGSSSGLPTADANGHLLGCARREDSPGQRADMHRHDWRFDVILQFRPRESYTPGAAAALEIARPAPIPDAVPGDPEMTETATRETLGFQAEVKQLL